MAERIPNAVAKLVVFRAILASDHVTPATGKTIAITISKNGGAFGNPNVGALNATEISSGFYKFTLDTTDTGTNGPVAWRGAVATIDDVGDVVEVVNATNAGFTGVPAVVAGANGGLPLGDASGRVDIGKLLGTAWLTPGTAGTPDVNVKLWNALTTVALPLVPATAGRTLVVDAAGLADANVVKVGPTGAGTAQTAGDIPARLPAALTANGNMKSSLVEILTTTLTETAGQLAGAFKKWFDVAAPVGTVNSIPNATAGAAGGLQIAGANAATTYATLTVTGAFSINGTSMVAQTGDNYARIGAAGAGLTALGDARIANLDAAVSTRLATAGYTVPLDAPGTRTAVGLASANLDTQLAAQNVTAMLTTAITESYRANGAAPTLAQALCELLAHMGETSITGTTKTTKKLDHSTTAQTFTLDSVTPSSITRAT